MKKSTKAILFSMFGFPGVGHMYLKKHIPGLLLTIGAGIALYFVLSVALQSAFDVVETMQGVGGTQDIGAISELVAQKSAAAKEEASASVTVLVIVWIVAILDILRIARQVDAPEPELKDD